MNRLPFASIVAVTLAALLLGPALAHADDITYAVDQNLSGLGGTVSITGTITTDGTQGALDESDILDIDFSVTENTGQTAYGLVNKIASYVPGTFTATPAGLFFDFSSYDHTSLYGEGDLFFTNGLEQAGGLGIGQVAASLSGNVEIASAPTPEPSSLILLGTGALGLVSVARRRLTA